MEAAFHRISQCARSAPPAQKKPAQGAAPMPSNSRSPDRLRLASRSLLGLSVALAAITITGPAAAVDAVAAADAAPEGQLEEVVVTATKRTEDAKDVPLSVGVVSASDLAALNVDSVEDISRLVPGISFAAHNNGPNGPGQDNITIRGVSSTVGNPTVGIYIDEVPLITITGYEGDAEPRLVDLDRVEVLRGPQGTLYGASSEGGTVRFITPTPDLHDYSAWVREELSDTKQGGFNYDTKGVLNIPVSDVFALRVSAEYGKDSGFIDRYALAGSIAENNATAGDLLRTHTNPDGNQLISIKGLYSPGDDLTITPSVLYQRYSASDSSVFIPAVGQFDTIAPVPDADTDSMLLPSLTVKKGFGFADFTSITSYLDRRVQRQSDGTFFNSAAIAEFVLDTVGTPPYTTNQHGNDYILGNVPSPVEFTDSFNTWTQEFRLQSPDDKARVRWVAGAFVDDQQWEHLDYETAPGFSAAFQNIYGYNIDTDQVLNPSIGTPSYNPDFWANDLVWTVHDHNDVKQYAIFGEIDADLLPTLHAGFGERYVWAEEKFDETGGGFFDFGGGGTQGTPYASEARFSTSTPKGTLAYDLSDDTSLYASAGKGFRLGGATTPNTNAPCVLGLAQLGIYSAPTSYGPDQLWSYEFGTKNVLFDKTLSVNADVYYITWKNIQQTITIPICGGAFNANVGDAEAIGGELEVRYKPTFLRGLTLSANAGGEHAYITASSNTVTAQVGQDVLYTPDVTANVTANYTWILTGASSAFVVADYEYTGKSYGSFIVSTPAAPNPAYVDPSYSVVNLNVGVNLGPFEVSLFAKNLLNNDTILQSPTINGITEGYTLRPRTIGMALQAKF
jgi:iron complex outermembrane receptor protein